MSSIFQWLIVFCLFSIEYSDTSDNMKPCYFSEPIYINKNNIDEFKNCNSVTAEIYITNETFITIIPEDLSIFETVKTFKGILNINAYHIKFTDLNFLKNLEKIDSKSGKSNDHSMVIEKTSLKSIELPAIKTIQGIILISDNKDLCYSQQLLRVLDKKFTDKAIITNNKNNTECCHEQCNDDGCWGPRADQCHNCKNEQIRTPGAVSDFICIKDCVTDVEVCMEKCVSYEGACFKLPVRERNSNNTQCTQCPDNTESINSIFYFGAIIAFITVISSSIIISLLVQIRDKINVSNIQANNVLPSNCEEEDHLEPRCTGVDVLNAINIATFRNCKIIYGDVYITNVSFIGMHPRHLEVLNSVTEITGYLNIEACHVDFKNLSFLRNLKTIGRNLSKTFTTMNIEQSSLTSLNLRSLVNILGKYGVSITNNKDLCYAENIEWTLLTEMIKVIRNRDINQCTIDGFVCDESCSEGGCWGAGPDQCLGCKEHNFGAICMLKCDKISCEYFCKFGCYGTCPHHCNCSGQVMHICSDCHNVQKLQYCHHECIAKRYNRNGQCMSCHEECKSGCSGTGTDECTACKHFKEGRNCVALCPKEKYTKNGECYPCHDLCKSGCTGPDFKNCYKQQNDINVKTTCNVLEYQYEGECKSCNSQCENGCSGPKASDCLSCKYIKDELNCVTSCPTNKYVSNGECKICDVQCIGGCNGPNADQCHFCEFLNEQKCVSHCPKGKYPFNGNCQACNEQCLNGCSGPGDDECESCRYVKHGHICKSSCPIDKYNDNGDCLQCNEACIDGCTGPEPKYGDGGCNFCNKVIIIDNIVVCLHLNDTCPVGYIDRIITSHQKELTALIGKTMCAQQQQLNILIILGTVVAVIIFLIVGIWSLYRKKIKFNFRQNEQIEMNRFDSLTDNDSIYSKHSLSRLPLIKVTEINTIKMLGKGAFGTVHEAVWNPESDSNSIPVATKVLHQGSTILSTKKFLDEAVIMASMDHPNIVHLIAICITTEIMLITKLMPLGCILNYIRSNKYDILPKHLLIWSTQIAKGMAYLEEKHLVHRDLAARNVLLETIHCIKIADFGLSKFVDTNDDSHTNFATKWLAIECLEERVFTHKSDVWAFGVTIWELLTFGERPFEKVQGRILPNELKLGLRLVQPPTCNADVYAILIRCWLLRPELRPNFSELENVFKKMSYKTSTYLVAYGKRHFKTLNEIPRANSRISNNSTYMYNDTQYQVNSPELYDYVIRSHQQDQEGIEANNLQPLIYEREGYLEPRNQNVGSDSGYEIIPSEHS